MAREKKIFGYGSHQQVELLINTLTHAHSVDNKTHVSLLTTLAGRPHTSSCSCRPAAKSSALAACNGEITPSSRLHLRRSRHLSWRCGVQVVHHLQQLRVHGVAGDPLECRLGGDGQHGLLPRAGGVADHVGAVGVVGSAVGPHALLHRRRRQVRLRHGRLRVREAGVRWRRRRPACDAGRVHHGRQRRHGLLRREPRGRVQPPRAGGAAGRRDRRQLRADGVHGGPERRVPRRPARGVDRRRRGVQERVRGVRVGAVLLQRRVREPRHVQAVGLLAVLQERVPEGVQLRLRRRDLDLHLRRRRHLLRHHLLPQHHQREVGRVVVEPAGAGRPAADERDQHGVPRRRPARGRHRRGTAAVPSPRRPRPRRRVPRARRRLALIITAERHRRDEAGPCRETMVRAETAQAKWTRHLPGLPPPHSEIPVTDKRALRERHSDSLSCEREFDWRDWILYFLRYFINLLHILEIQS